MHFQLLHKVQLFGKNYKQAFHKFTQLFQHNFTATYTRIFAFDLFNHFPPSSSFFFFRVRGEGSEDFDISEVPALAILPLVDFTELLSVKQPLAARKLTLVLHCLRFY